MIPRGWYVFDPEDYECGGIVTADDVSALLDMQDARRALGE